jgi:DNA invertase Pin-like site-specific DNA recombinase
MSSQPQKTEGQILKDVGGGKYRDSYLIYARKSTDDIENQKNSLAYQKAEIGRYAKREGLRIAPVTLPGFCTDGVISERHSGFKESGDMIFGEGNTVQYRIERPKFLRLAQFLSKGHFKGVIFLIWDRASRNASDNTLIQKLIKSGADIRFVLTQYDKTSAGELHMDVDAAFAIHHSRNTREKVTLTIRNSRDKGLWTNRAPVGYLNRGNMNDKPQDPTRAPIIKRMFELAATGEWSLSGLARWAIDQGFTMPPQRRRRTREEILAEEEDDVRVEIEPVSRPPTANSIHKILTNPFYAGRVLGNEGKWVPSASHESIVDDWLFREVQEQLRKKNKGIHYKEALSHPLRAFARCGGCGRVYTPYTQKGTVYYGSRCKKGCINPP